MAFPHDDDRHLDHALQLAAAAVGLASPNPTVGCVVVSDSGQILGEGAHHYDALDHAEVVALKQAATQGHSTRQTTAYVTLEPCTVHGRTGPCSDALIVAGIRRCVIATTDPNPEVNGRGIARLREAGIEVLLATPASPAARQARALNDAFAVSIRRSRPMVTLKAALSVDGKLAPAPTRRTTTAPHWLTGEAARADVQGLRHATDCILTGVGTVLADDPSLTDRTDLPRRRKLLRVVLDSQLRTPHHSRIVETAAEDLLIVCVQNGPGKDKAHELEKRGVEVLQLEGDSHRIDLHLLLAELHRRKLLSVLAESGSALNASLLRADSVDKLVLYYAEAELGTDALPFATQGLSPFMLQQQLQQQTRATFPHGGSEDVRIAGYLHDPWA